MRRNASGRDCTHQIQASQSVTEISTAETEQMYMYTYHCSDSEQLLEVLEARTALSFRLGHSKLPAGFEGMSCLEMAGCRIPS